MATKSKTKVQKATAPKKAAKKVVAKKTVVSKKWYSRPLVLWHKVAARIRRLMARRPHRSFRMTRRRDYKRSLKLPGYWSFTNYVRATLWQNKLLFGGLVLTYMMLTIVITGYDSQTAYSNLATTIKSTGGDLFTGNWGAIGQAGIVVASAATAGLNQNPSDVQKVLAGLVGFFAWLATVWLLRNTLAGHHPKLRDGLYNSGAPILATLLVGLIVVLQVLPASLAIIIYNAASYSGLMDSAATAVMVWAGIVLLTLLSIYWISSSLIALVIVTLPGMYPLHAIRAAGDLVVGRRLRILFRLAWLLFVIVVTWAIIVIPVVLFDDWIKQIVPAISWLPLVPLTVFTMSSVTLVFAASYIYLLYRRVVDDDAAPA